MAFIVKSSTLNREKTGLEEEWVEFQPGVEFLIRGMGHNFVQVGIQAYAEDQERVRNRFLAGDVSALAKGKTMVDINTTVLGTLVLADWKGVKLETGEDLEYAPDTAKAIVSDPDSIKLVEWLIAEATRITKEAQERLAERLGKSSSASAGKKSGATKPRSNAQSPSDSE